MAIKKEYREYARRLEGVVFKELSERVPGGVITPVITSVITGAIMFWFQTFNARFISACCTSDGHGSSLSALAVYRMTVAALF